MAEGLLLLLLTAARQKEEERLLIPLLLFPLQLAPAALEARQAAVAIDGRKRARSRKKEKRRTKAEERASSCSFLFLDEFLSNGRLLGRATFLSPLNFSSPSKFETRSTRTRVALAGERRRTTASVPKPHNTMIRFCPNDGTLLMSKKERERKRRKTSTTTRRLIFFPFSFSTTSTSSKKKKNSRPRSPPRGALPRAARLRLRGVPLRRACRGRGKKRRRRHEPTAATAFLGRCLGDRHRRRQGARPPPPARAGARSRRRRHVGCRGLTEDGARSLPRVRRERGVLPRGADPLGRRARDALLEVCGLRAPVAGGALKLTYVFFFSDFFLHCENLGFCGKQKKKKRNDGARRGF